jgi:hypothetical protein
LLGKQTARYRERLKSADVGCGIATGGQFIIAAFASKQRPRATYTVADPVFTFDALAVTIMVVPIKGRHLK